MSYSTQGSTEGEGGKLPIDVPDPGARRVDQLAATLPDLEVDNDDQAADSIEQCCISSFQCFLKNPVEPYKQYKK